VSREGHFGYCKNKEYRFEVPAGEFERAVLERFKKLSGRNNVSEGTVSRTNKRLRTELRWLLERKDVLERAFRAPRYQNGSPRWTMFELFAWRR